MLILRLLVLRLQDTITSRSQVFVPILAVLLLFTVFAGRVLLASTVVGGEVAIGGVLRELILACAVLALVYLSGFLHWSLGVGLAVLYALYFTANMEMAAAMDTVVELQDAIFATDATFLEASGFGFSFPVYTLLLIVVSVGFALSLRPILRYSRYFHRREGILVAVVAALAFAIASAAAPSGMTWQDDSLIVRSLEVSMQRAYTAAEGVAEQERAPSDEPTPAHAPEQPEAAAVQEESEETDRIDLSDAALLYPQAREQDRNVLLVVIEGIPGVYLEQVQERSGVSYPVTMEAFSEIAGGGLTLSQSVAHARQTIRGLYSTLTGDYPRLDMSTPKIYPFIETEKQQRPPALPAALSRLDYHTVYLQAADLSFMSKDLFMPEAGFEEVIGKEHFDYQHVPFEWGPDDKAYFEQVADYIEDELRGQHEPWFLTLLTVGTHHPYGVTEEYAAEYPNPKIASVAYLDEALEAFFRELESTEVLDDTAVFIVSDESHGVTGHPFGRYWGTTVVRLPESDEHVMQDDVFGLVDIPISVLDYLGAESEAGAFPGRSVLRDYTAPRTMHFGPFIADEITDEEGVGHHIFERRGAKNFTRYTPIGEGIFVPEYDREPDPDSAADADLAARLEQSFATANSLARAEARTEQERERETLVQPVAETWSLISNTDYEIDPGEGQMLSSAQYLEVEAGSLVTVRLDLEVEGAESNHTGGEPMLRPSLGMLSEYERVDIDLPEMPAMSAGDAFEVETTFPATETLSRVWLDLRAFSLLDDRTVELAVNELSLEVLPPLPFVAHSAGRYQGHTYTNSVEALQRNASDYSVFEIDFEWTEDGRLVGLHDWDVIFERLYGFEPEAPLSYAELLELQSTPDITPPTLADIEDFLTEHPDARIITDVKRDNLKALERIAAEIENHEQRIIPQVYQPERFGSVAELGYENIIWTLYRFPGNRTPDLVLERVEAMQEDYPDSLFAVTLPSELAEDGTPMRLATAGVPVYAHTVNTCEELQQLRRTGVSAVYTNDLTTDECR